jgi:hypothetical protein
VLANHLVLKFNRSECLDPDLGQLRVDSRNAMLHLIQASPALPVSTPTCHYFCQMTRTYATPPQLTEPLIQEIKRPKRSSQDEPACQCAANGRSHNMLRAEPLCGSSSLLEDKDIPLPHDLGRSCLPTCQLSQIGDLEPNQTRASNFKSLLLPRYIFPISSAPLLSFVYTH